MSQAAGGRSGPSPSARPRTGVLASLGNINPLLFALIVLFLAVALLSDRFLTFTNQMNITRQAAVFLIIAVGQTFVISSRGIDLSVGSIVGLTGCVMATMLLSGAPVVFALGVGIGLGALVGRSWASTTSCTSSRESCSGAPRSMAGWAPWSGPCSES